ncbi:hypothetical protein ATANTOWER_006340 [Ataeniobius toweri]|uniref:Uncharacterized protein n=1 Tax=Ataeniobius toweri TaxID=208326 RepID=A0ABU7CEZ1_9TELE|nr:hypothetical protein [Ataeniobius toweri]
MCVLDHHLLSLLVETTLLSKILLGFQRFHDVIQRETAPKHHRLSTVFNSGHEVLSRIFILCFTLQPSGAFVTDTLKLPLILPNYSVPRKSPSRVCRDKLEIFMAVMVGPKSCLHHSQINS